MPGDTPASLFKSEEELARLPASERIRYRLVGAQRRYHANDNISAYVRDGELDELRDEVASRLQFLQNASGAVPGPMDCWLALRGTKTLAVRMRQHDASGRRIAEWLEHHPAVRRVYYPGLPSHEQHDLACRQMTGFGGMISLELGSADRARRMAEATRIFALAESLGGVESLIGHPASMTHASVPQAMREAMGLTDGLVRLSVGIEETEDLIADLDQALKKGS